MCAVAFALFLPNILLNQVTPEFEVKAGSEVFQLAEAAPDDSTLRVRLTGEDLDGNMVDSSFILPLGAKGTDGATRLKAGAGIEFRTEDGAIMVDNIDFGGSAEQLGIDFDWVLAGLDVKADRMAKEVFFLPAFILLGLIYMVQARRRRTEDGSEVTA